MINLRKNSAEKGINIRGKFFSTNYKNYFQERKNNHKQKEHINPANTDILFHGTLRSQMDSLSTFHNDQYFSDEL